MSVTVTLSGANSVQDSSRAPRGSWGARQSPSLPRRPGSRSGPWTELCRKWWDCSKLPLCLLRAGFRSVISETWSIAIVGGRWSRCRKQTLIWRNECFVQQVTLYSLSYTRLAGVQDDGKTGRGIVVQVVLVRPDRGLVCLQGVKVGCVPLGDDCDHHVLQVVLSAAVLGRIVVLVSEVQTKCSAPLSCLSAGSRGRQCPTGRWL